MMNHNDPIIEELRNIRDEHAKKFNYDLNAICKDYMEHQKTCGHPIVSFDGKKKKVEKENGK